MHRKAYARILVGRSVEGGLRGDLPPWQAGHDIGVIAGTKSVGMGWLIAPLAQPNDGTVALVESRLDGAADYITLPHSHTGLLFSQSVVHQMCAFLRNGRFLHA